MTTCPKCNALFADGASGCPACAQSKTQTPKGGIGCLGCLGLFLLMALALMILNFTPWGFAYKLMRDSGVGYMAGNLGSIRSALSIYYGDMEGQYPGDLNSLTISGKYMSVIPRTWAGGETAYDVPHQPTQEVRHGSAPVDAGGWLYNNIQGNANIGTVVIDCTHTDIRGRVWMDY